MNALPGPTPGIRPCRPSPCGMATRALVAVSLATLGLVGCSGMYYGAMEKLGMPKREILSDRVASARKEQAKAKETFESALDQFRSVVSVDAGDLERQYDKLSTQYDRCETRAQAVSDRVDSIEDVARALFREWEAELDEYQSPSLRQSSEQQLRQTRDLYDDLMTAMRRAEDKMTPVLAAFREQVLFLKHNLNAAAIASLQGEVVTIEREVAALVVEMEQAIAEADAFISQMKR